MAVWRTSPVAEVCTMVTDGSHFSPSTTPTGYPYVTVRDIKQGQIDFENCAFVSEASFDELRRNGCAPLVGDVLFSKDGTVGKVALVDSPREFVVLSSLAILRPNASLIEPAFLSYVLMSPAFLGAAIGQKTGVAIRRIILKHLKQIPIPYPSLAEQRRIVSILDEAFEGIATAKANAEKNRQNARELFTNGLEGVFSEGASRWGCVALERIGATQTGSTPKSSEPENLGDYLPFVKPGDFNRDGSITFDNEGLSEGGAKKARRVKANSALMVCIGATIGKAGFSEREIATNQQVNAWTPTTDTSAKFIYYQMTTGNFQRRVRQNAGQATLPIINKSKWSALTVVVPPTLEEQTKIVADLDLLLAESMNLEAVYERKLAVLDELKKALLHQAFTGALTTKSTDKQLEAVA
ncbi:restriction endonuclease subunit S [Accumulibacter sp.]|uniref:restriction endonuclease subunit S n=1 Tax=Accumulibacter sp. TaxID=2053492 RepID=UPI00258CCD51|nr:restriction endonuclease subunit S [Accumulibacter sp.]